MKCKLMILRKHRRENGKSGMPLRKTDFVNSET